MIGRLRGRILVKQPPHLLLDVNGVGYEIEAPMSTFYVLPAGNDEIVLHTHLAVREDAHILYGFARESDRTLFRALLKVSGVGGKMALGVLSGMTADEFAQAVQAADIAALTRLPGVGKKTAERLVVEMRDKLDAIASLPGAVAAKPAAAQPAGADQDAVSALIALGYKAPEASRMVSKVYSDGMDTESVIRAALKGTVA
ncbi:MAG: Holliday junction branch migration protein RuvA [Gammaproteobacteria bacterium]|nr:Holliday junction branch migration protein RuvA [Gammaproteobacteria bacterium]